MYRRNELETTTIRSNTSYVGETIEDKIKRITNNKEPISDGAPLIYQERKDGVQPEYNIRTDRFEIAIEAMDKVAKAYAAKREERHKPKDLGEEANKNMKKEEKNGGPEPIQGTKPTS